MLYSFLRKDGTLYTRIDTEDPRAELEAIKTYSPEVASFEECVETEEAESNGGN